MTGSVVVFDELGPPASPREIKGLCGVTDLDRYAIRRFPSNPDVGWPTVT